MLFSLLDGSVRSSLWSISLCCFILKKKIIATEYFYSCTMTKMILFHWVAISGFLCASNFVMLSSLVL
jgi:hypothetical protein